MTARLAAEFLRKEVGHDRDAGEVKLVEVAADGIGVGLGNVPRADQFDALDVRNGGGAGQHFVFGRLILVDRQKETVASVAKVAEDNGVAGRGGVHKGSGRAV